MGVPSDILFEKGKKLVEIDLRGEAWMDTIVDFSNSGFGKLGRLLRVGGNIIGTSSNGGVKWLTSFILLKQEICFLICCMFFRRFAQHCGIDSSAGGANPAESQNYNWGGWSQWQWWASPWPAAWWWTRQPRRSKKWKLPPCRDFQWIQDLTRLVQSLDDAKMTHKPPVSIKPHFCEIKNILEVLPHLHILVSITIPHSQFKRGRRVQAKNSLNWEI